MAHRHARVALLLAALFATATREQSAKAPEGRVSRNCPAGRAILLSLFARSPLEFLSSSPEDEPPDRPNSHASPECLRRIAS